MANTTNLDLVKPLGTDHALVSVINSNMDKIDANAGNVDSSLNSLGDGLAIIANGDTHAAITSGQFVYVRGHNTLSEGLYVATANVAANGALSASNLSADTSGGLNTVYSTLNSKLPITYTNSKYCSNTEGTLTLEVPAGKYLVQICGKTQTSDNFINMTLDDAAATSQSYLGALIGTNIGSKVITAQTTNIVTYNETHTMTISYSANWYRVQVFATLIQ